MVMISDLRWNCDNGQLQHLFCELLLYIFGRGGYWIRILSLIDCFLTALITGSEAGVKKVKVAQAHTWLPPQPLRCPATNFPAWWTEAWWVWTVCLRLLSDSVTAAIWTRALLCTLITQLHARLPGLKTRKAEIKILRGNLTESRRKVKEMYGS